MITAAALARINAADVKRLLVGLSGGMDSSVLLHALVNANPEPPIQALHVNHGLLPEAADFEAASQRLCKSLGVPLEVRSVTVASSGSLEESARLARYGAFEALLREGDLLLLAHHADDQAETVLFRLFRGSRVEGLQGMPEERQVGAARLYRPLLAIRRTAIQAYADRFQVPYVDDPSNLDLTLDRNYLRQRILPLLEARWPDVTQTLLEAAARDEARRTEKATRLKEELLTLQTSKDSLALDKLTQLPALKAQELIDTWLLSRELPLMSQPALERFVTHFLPKAEGTFQFDTLELRKYQGQLHLLRQLPPAEPYDFPLQEGSHSIPGGLVTTNLCQGEGLAPGTSYQVRPRQGGEKLKQGRTRTLKNLLQEAQVPPWLRDRLPLIFADDTLVATAAIPAWGVAMLVADGHAPEPNQPALQVSLTLADRLKI